MLFTVLGTCPAYFTCQPIIYYAYRLRYLSAASRKYGPTLPEVPYSQSNTIEFSDRSRVKYRRNAVTRCLSGKITGSCSLAISKRMTSLSLFFTLLRQSPFPYNSFAPFIFSLLLEQLLYILSSLFLSSYIPVIIRSAKSRACIRTAAQSSPGHTHLWLIVSIRQPHCQHSTTTCCIYIL